MKSREDFLSEGRVALENARGNASGKGGSLKPRLSGIEKDAVYFFIGRDGRVHRFQARPEAGEKFLGSCPIPGVAVKLEFLKDWAKFAMKVRAILAEADMG